MLDMRFEKKFTFLAFDYTIFMELINLFDRRNINQAYINPATGKPYKFGDTTVLTLDDPDYRIFTWEEIQSYLNPLRVGPPRQVYFGFKLNW